MKILLLSSTNNPSNGYGSVTHNLCDFLSKKVEIILYLPKNCERINVSYPVKYVLPDYTYTFKSKKIIDYLMFSSNEKIDIVHSLVEFPYVLLGDKISASLRIPHVISTYGSYSVSHLSMWPEKRFMKQAYARAKLIIVSSLFTKNILQSYGIKTPINVIHPGIDAGRIIQKSRTYDLRKKYFGQKIFLTVGGVKPRRGQDLVVKALHILKKKRKDFHYFIVGSVGTWGEELKKIVTRLNLEENVTFLGKVTERERELYFQLCDIYIQTPRMIGGRFEGFGITYLEASACGKPIIATRSGGSEDAIVDGETGIVVDEDDINGLVDVIERLMDSPSLMKKLGVNGKKYALKHDWKMIGRQYLNLYENL